MYDEEKKKFIRLEGEGRELTVDEMIEYMKDLVRNIQLYP